MILKVFVTMLAGYGVVHFMGWPAFWIGLAVTFVLGAIRAIVELFSAP